MNLFFRIKRRLKYDWHRLTDAIYRQFLFTPTVLTTEETINHILAHKCSLARFGDGELAYMFGKSLNFQEYSPILADKLRQTFSSSSILVAIPRVFGDLKSYNSVEISFWRNHFYFHRRNWYKLLNRNNTYGNTFTSRFYSMAWDYAASSLSVPLLKQLWNNRNIIFVEGEFSRLGVGNDLFQNAKSVQRILCPAKNAFSRYDEILNECCRQETDTLFILALGPTATVLANDLSINGYQALDLGHIDIEYEWWRTKAKEKTPIKAKFSNEAFILKASDQEVQGELGSEILRHYRNEIIADFS